MKLTVQRKHLVEVLTKCSTVTKTKSPHPAASCVRLIASTRLDADATDLYHYISTSTVLESLPTMGATLVNCRDLLERVKTFVEGPVQLTLDGDKLRVQSGKRKHAVPVLPAAEFPTAPPSTPEQWLELPANALAGLLGKVKHAIATVTARPAINCVLLELKSGNLHATATDARRMAYDLIPANSGSESWLVPLASVEAILGSITDQPTSIGTSGDQFQVKSGDVLFATRLINDTFPPVRDQLSAVERNPIRVVRKDLLDAVASVQTASDERAGIITLSVTNGLLKLSADGSGEAEDELDVVYEGRDVKASLMAGYLRDALTSLEADAVTLSISGDLDPVFVSSSPDPGFRLIMPCRP